MKPIFIALLIFIPFLCTGHVPNANAEVCKSTNLTDLAAEKDCELPIGTRFILNYVVVDEFGHPVDCDGQECYRCRHMKNIFIDVYTPNGTFNDPAVIKKVCDRFGNYVIDGYKCKLGKINRGQPRIVVRFANQKDIK